MLHGFFIEVPGKIPYEPLNHASIFLKKNTQMFSLDGILDNRRLISVAPLSPSLFPLHIHMQVRPRVAPHLFLEMRLVAQVKFF